MNNLNVSVNTFVTHTIRSTITQTVHKTDSNNAMVLSLVLSMADGRRLKFRHINMPLWPMALPQQVSLHKLPMAAGKNLLCHSAMAPLYNNNACHTVVIRIQLYDFISGFTSRKQGQCCISSNKFLDKLHINILSLFFSFLTPQVTQYQITKFYG